MANFPAVKLFDTVIGVDIHAGAGFPVHPYLGPIYLWSSPKFPSTNVYINGLPACSVGAMGYFFHIPQVIPANPTNATYWTRYLTNIAMGVCLMGLTTFANIAIATIAAFIPKPKSVEDFIKDVTGIDTSNSAKAWNDISKSFSAFTMWPTWVKLLMPPIPYVGAQGSAAVGSPNVTVCGGPLAFSAPLMGTSCSDIPVVPNAALLGFSNVMVGISLGDFMKTLAASTLKAGVSYGIGKGLSRLPGKRSVN